MSSETEAPPAAERGVDSLLFGVSAGFGLIAAFALTFSAFQLVWPQLGEGIAFTTYGRLRPIALNALVYGWLGHGLLAVAVLVVSRLGTPAMWSPGLARAGAALSSVGVLVGLVIIAAAGNDGPFLFEFPLVVDLVVAVGFATTAFVLLRSVASSEASRRPALWFSLAGALWLPLGFVAGAVPGVDGVNATLQNAFAVTTVVTLALLGLGLGAAYYVVGEERGTQDGTRVSRLGFWSFAFIAAWTAPRLLMFGPSADWLETIAVAFSLILLVPVLALSADLVGRSTQLPSRGPVLAGTAFFVAFAALNVVASFRSPSSVTRFTSWEDALLLLPLLGAAGCWLAAVVLHRSPRRWGWPLVAGGTGLAAVAALAGGLHQGLEWVGGVNAGDPTTSGLQFARSSTVWLALSAVGIAVAGAGIVAVAFASLRQRDPEPVPPYEPHEDDPEPAEAVTMSVLAQGAVGLFALAALSVFIIPALDTPNRTPTLLAEERQFADGSLAAQGRDLYVTEGCVYCHTQQVRPIISDVGLGAVSRPGDFVDESPVLAGYRRVGPDLFHIGERTTSTRLLLERLRSPRAGFDSSDVGWQGMPSYDYLSDSELLAIAEYLGALK